MFDNMARDAFSNSPDGQRLFDLHGWPWRPCLVADAETEQRLFDKQVRYHQLFLLGLMVGLIVFQVTYRPGVNELAALLFVATVMVVGYATRWFVFRDAVRGLPRASVRPRAAWRLESLAANHSRKGLASCVFASMLFLALSLWLIVSQGAIVFGILCMFFAIQCVVSWSYALWRHRPAAPQAPKTSMVSR